MTEEFLKANPHITAKQIRQVENAPEDFTPRPMDKERRDCGLEWVRDEGEMSVWKATSFVYVTVDQTRTCRYAGSIGVQLRAGDTLSLLMNRDGCNYDAYRCT